MFLPTYLTTYYSYHQAALLAFCLLLNATITLLCIYLPKIYAIYFINEDDLKFYTAQGGAGITQVTGVVSSDNNETKRNQIVPNPDWKGQLFSTFSTFCFCPLSSLLSSYHDIKCSLKVSWCLWKCELHNNEDICPFRGVNLHLVSTVVMQNKMPKLQRQLNLLLQF